MRSNICSLLGILLLLGAGAACSDDGERTSRPLTDVSDASIDPEGDAPSHHVDGDTPSDAASEPDTSPPEGPTYFQDVKPIIDGRCVKCHTDGGIAPFPLENYQQVSNMRTPIQENVTDKTMPPWLASDQCNTYQHDTSLTDEQIDTINAWVEADAPKGDPANEGKALESVGSGGLSRVDQTLTMDESYEPQQSPDDYRCFVIDWPYENDRYVTGFDIEPDQKQLVHHVIAYVAPPEYADDAAQKDANEEGQGYTCFGGPGVGMNGNDPREMTKWIGGWAPGTPGTEYAPGTGIKVEGGSKLILQIHYNTLSSEPAPDQTKAHFKIDEEVEKEAINFPFMDPNWMQGDNMKIPAGDSEVKHSFEVPVAGILSMLEDDVQSVDIHAALLHMHQLGTRARLWVANPDQTEDCILDIPRWDFDWQMTYSLKEPLTVDASDWVGLECEWDNSRANQPIIDGEQQSPEERTWGEGTHDEMCLGVMYVTFNK